MCKNCAALCFNVCICGFLDCVYISVLSASVMIHETAGYFISVAQYCSWPKSVSIYLSLVTFVWLSVFCPPFSLSLQRKAVVDVQVCIY